MKFYAIGGLGTDGRLFDKLDLGDFHHLQFLDWPNIHDCNSLQQYAKRFVQHINQEEPFGLIGVSMGGMLCSELTHLVKPKAVILISSAVNKMELPIHFRLAGKADILKLFPEEIFKMPPTAIKLLFGSKSALMQDYIKKMDVKYCKKAAQLICKWDSLKTINKSIPFLHIKGKNDLVLPYISNYMYLIESGGHSLIIENVEETILAINQFIKKNLA